MEKFYLDEQTALVGDGCVKDIRAVDEREFFKLCSKVKSIFLKQLELQRDNMLSEMEIQKKAIIGYEGEVNYLKEKIRTILAELQVGHVEVPEWYSDLIEGIYQENWGLAGISQWFGKAYSQSSSAKLIGDRIYFMESGHMILKPQRMEKLRREQLLRALLLLTPEQRMDREYHEVYLLDGTRVTVFRSSMTKPDQDVVIFRKYVVPRYCFEEQAERGTIPFRVIPLFESMVKLGFNVTFTGAVRSAKTTFLSTWQSYEDPALEGVLLETDPEIPLHRMMPDSPIVQLLAEGDRLDSVVKNILRSDADYVIFAEARDGQALDAAVRIASKGTKRMKMTFHTRRPTDFPLDAALEIIKFREVPLELMRQKVAASFDYVFHFIQLKDKSKKRLNSIYQMELDGRSNEVIMEPICLYDPYRDDWDFYGVISKEKRQYGMQEDSEVFLQFEKTLKQLSCTEGGGLACKEI